MLPSNPQVVGKGGNGSGHRVRGRDLTRHADQGAEQGGEPVAVGTAGHVDQPLPPDCPTLCSALQKPRRPQTQMGPQHVLNPEPKGYCLFPLPIPGRGPTGGQGPGTKEWTLAFDQGQAPRSQKPISRGSVQYMDSETLPSPLLGQQDQELPSWVPVWCLWRPCPPVPAWGRQLL